MNPGFLPHQRGSQCPCGLVLEARHHVALDRQGEGRGRVLGRLRGSRNVRIAPYIACPRCGKEAFGVLMIPGRHYVPRCRACCYSKHFRLPAARIGSLKGIYSHSTAPARSAVARATTSGEEDELDALQIRSPATGGVPIPVVTAPDEDRGLLGAVPDEPERSGTPGSCAGVAVALH